MCVCANAQQGRITALICVHARQDRSMLQFGSVCLLWQRQLGIQLTTNLTSYMQQLVLEAWFEYVAMLVLMLSVCSHVFGQCMSYS